MSDRDDTEASRAAEAAETAEAAAAKDAAAAEKETARGLRPGQRSKNFWPSTKRLVREIGPERFYLLAAILVGVVSVAFSVVGPRILGRATDIIFTGLISKNLPAGASPDEVIAQLRADGVRLLYPELKRGTADSRINFIHPKDAGGVLVELVEPAAGH